MPRKLSILIIAFICLFIIFQSSIGFVHESDNKKYRDLSKINGITHYGMKIKEEKAVFRKKDTIITLIYSNKESDDNMDKYVRRFYDLLIQKIKEINPDALPPDKMTIVISNCKFCKIGYCKKKNRKEVSLTLHIKGKKKKEIAFTHRDIIDKKKYISLVNKAISHLLNI